MKKLRKLTNHRGFQYLVFGLGLMLFSWPIMSIPTPGAGLFVYLFLIWAGLIAVLMVMGAGFAPEDVEE